MSSQKIPTDSFLNLTQQPLAGSSFNSLLRVFLENNFNIDLPYLPRALYVGLMSFCLTPLRLYEKHKFEKKVDKIKHVEKSKKPSSEIDKTVDKLIEKQKKK